VPRLPLKFHCAPSPTGRFPEEELDDELDEELDEEELEADELVLLDADDDAELLEELLDDDPLVAAPQAVMARIAKSRIIFFIVH
jgi:hypothetical protein